MVLQLTHDSSAFTMQPPSLAARSFASQTRLRVTTIPEKDGKDSSNEDQPSPLFDINEIDSDSTFQVQDTDGDDDDMEMDVSDIDVEYDLGYDNDYKDDDLYKRNIQDLETDIYANMIQGSSNAINPLSASADFTRDQDDILTEREDRFYVNQSGLTLVREKCILIGVENLAARFSSTRDKKDQVYFDIDQSLDEMKELISTSGMDLAGVMTQKMNDVNPRTYIGTGKVIEAQALLAEVDACTVIFDAELSPGQQKALENAFNKEVIQNDFLGSEKAVSA